MARDDWHPLRLTFRRETAKAIAVAGPEGIEEHWRFGPYRRQAQAAMTVLAEMHAQVCDHAAARLRTAGQIEGAEAAEGLARAMRLSGWPRRNPEETSGSCGNAEGQEISGP